MPGVSPSLCPGMVSTCRLFVRKTCGHWGSEQSLAVPEPILMQSVCHSLWSCREVLGRERLLKFESRHMRVWKIVPTHNGFAAMAPGPPMSARANVFRSHSFTPGVPLSEAADGHLDVSSLPTNLASSSSETSPQSASHSEPATATVAIPGVAQAEQQCLFP